MPARMSHLFRLVAVVAITGGLTTACARPANGAPHKADPKSFGDVFKRAQSGDVITLEPGDYGAVRITNKTFEKPIVIEAGAATFDGFTGSNLDGVEIRGGTFRLPPGKIKPSTGNMVYGFALRFDGVRNFRLKGMSIVGPGAPLGVVDGPFGEGGGVLFNVGENIEIGETRFTGLKNGIVMSGTTGFRIVQNTFTGMRSDGMTIGTSRSGLIEGNDCSGTRIRDKEHPDCIQLFSRPTAPPTADVVIRKNRAAGKTQGILLANHTRAGVNDGGYDRILIEDNDLTVGFPNAIALIDARDSIVRNNRVNTFPGSEYAARMTFRGEVKQCGNLVAEREGKKPRLVDKPC